MTRAARPLRLVMSALLAGCVGASGPPLGPTPLPTQPGCSIASQPNALCVLVLGDSIAAGTPLTGDDRWWVRMQRLLTDHAPDRPVEVANWAVPGAHVDVLESAARDQPQVASFDVAIVIEGVNDEATLPIEAWAARYEASVAELERKGVDVVVATPPPGFEAGSFTTRYDGLADALRRIAHGQRNVLDLAQRWRADGPSAAAGYYSDLIHQGHRGQARMAALATALIIELRR